MLYWTSNARIHFTIHRALLARLVERDGELVAVQAYDVAVAEFLM